MLGEHITRLRNTSALWRWSRVVVYVERNLGFEAEHHARAFDGFPGVTFRIDQTAQRVGVYTTNAVKHAACTMLNTYMREQRVNMYESFVSRDIHAVKTRLREQLHTYSYQFKSPADTFGSMKVALSGKVGGMKDDIVICLQLGIYFTAFDLQEKNTQNTLIT